MRDTRQQVRDLIAFGLSQRQIGRKCGVESATMHFIATDDNYVISNKINARLVSELNSLHAEMREILEGVNK